MTSEERIPYPHIRGGGVVLPDCSQGVYRPFRLTTGEKRQLIKGLAEKGLQGIDDFLAKPKDQGAVAERMEEIRQRINEQLEKVQARRRESMDDEIRRLVERGAIVQGRTDDGFMEDDASFRRFSSEQIRGEILANDLIGIIEGREYEKDYVEKVSFFRKIWNSIRAFFRWFLKKFLSVLGRIKRLFSRKDKDRDQGSGGSKKRPKGAISLPFPSIQGDLDRWEKEMDKRIDEDPHLQKAVNQRISDKYGYDSGRIELKRSFDPGWYKEEAKKVLGEEVRSSAEKKKTELERERSDLARSKDDIKEKERKLREELMHKEKKLLQENEESEKNIDEMTHKEMKKELINSLSFMGYIERPMDSSLEDASMEWEITEALVEKFSEFILAEVMGRSSGMKDRRGRQISDAGVYEKARMRTIAEEPRMDMLQTLVNARINHPRDRGIEPFDVVVHREVTTSELHGVILVDVSGSMEENLRLEAAKRSVLALTQAIKRENPRNKVDLISISTRARPVTLKEIMTLEPHGFTNHQEGFALARTLLEGSRSDRHLLFLITDGLPEAYLDISGNPIAGDLEKAMDLTLIEVSSLVRVPDLSFEIFLLEPEDNTFIEAAKRIAKAGNGDVIVADPQELAYKVIGEYTTSGKVLEGI